MTCAGVIFLNSVCWRWRFLMNKRNKATADSLYVVPGPWVSWPSAWPARYLSASPRTWDRLIEVLTASKSPVRVPPLSAQQDSPHPPAEMQMPWGRGKFLFLDRAAEEALSQSAWWMKRSEQLFKLGPASAKVLRPTRSLSISHIILLALVWLGQSFSAHKSSCQPGSVSILKYTGIATCRFSI